MFLHFLLTIDIITKPFSPLLDMRLQRFFMASLTHPLSMANTQWAHLRFVLIHRAVFLVSKSSHHAQLPTDIVVNGTVFANTSAILSDPGCQSAQTVRRFSIVIH